MADKVKRGLWRWRSGPLRRRSDVAEAWAGLVAWALIALCGPAAGVATAVGYQAAVLAESHDGRSVSAVLTEDASSRAVPVTGTAATGGGRTPATVAWLTPEGGRHTGEALVSAGSDAGDTVTVRLDERGQVQDATTAGEAWTGGVAAGILAAILVCAAVLIAHRALRRGLDACRFAAWEREWAEVGPRWSGRTA